MTLRSPIFTKIAQGTNFSSLATALGTAIVLLATPAPSPFVQKSWPNPTGKVYLNSGYTDPSEFWMLKDKFFGPAGQGPTYSWPNPQGQRVRNEQGFTDASEFWMLNSASPLSQRDWPNPQSIKSRNEYSGFRESYKVLLFGIPAPPFYRTDWPNPSGPKIRNEQGFTDSSEFWMLKDQFFGPAGQGPTYSWPNPQIVKPRSEYGSTDSYKVLLFGAPPPPFFLTDWQNPRGPKGPVGDQLGFIDPTEFWMLKDQFFGPPGMGPTYDWPNPQRVKLRSEYGFSDQYKVLLFAAPPSPFYLTDWQNPRGPKGPVGDQLGFIDPTEYWMLNSIYPFSQGDWTNPQAPRQRSEYAGFSDPYKVLLFAAPPSPFYLTDWQNPRGARGLISDQLGFTDPTEYWMLNSLQPFNQVDWSNPLRAKPPIIGYDLKLNLQLQIVPLPFSQQSWPNPYQVRQTSPSHVDQNKFSLYQTYPFMQSEWQNPLRAKPAPVGFVGHFDVYKVNLKSNPQRQLDWPNPSLGARRTFANFGFSVRQQIIPGVFEIPGTGQLLLTTFQPITTLDSAHHWRTKVSLMGSVTPKSTLQGNIDQKRDLEGGGES